MDSSTDQPDMTKPPRARVADAVDTDAAPETPRNRDYLEGFLAAKTGTAVGGEGSDLQADVIAALREIFDPEIPVNIYDLGTILDEANVAIRAGHHCAQPLMDYLGVPATARASFGVYSTEADIDALMAGIARTRKIFGKG